MEIRMGHTYKTRVEGFDISITQGLKEVTIVSYGKFKSCPKNDFKIKRRKDGILTVTGKYKDYQKLKTAFIEVLKEAKNDSDYTSTKGTGKRGRDTGERSSRSSKPNKKDGSEASTTSVLDSTGGNKYATCDR
jgi:hypothetical protein